jgi:hypothetical protein
MSKHKILRYNSEGITHRWRCAFCRTENLGTVDMCSYCHRMKQAVVYQRATVTLPTNSIKVDSDGRWLNWTEEGDDLVEVTE